MSQSFEQYRERRRREIDDALERILPIPPVCPGLIAETMRYSVFAGGKRLRPILTLAAAEAVSSEEDPQPPEDLPRGLAMPGACAVELIHTYSLVHDDLPPMDDDTLRRGRPTAHVAFGEGFAILSGDALLTHAFVALSQPRSGGGPDYERRQIRAVARLAEAAGAGGMVGGQVLDLNASGTGAEGANREVDADRVLRDMHERKTGSLIRAAAVVGGILSGGTDDTVDVLDRYAAHLGLAFQIVDDILDVEGTVAALGKTAGKDAAAEKPTYPAIHGLERSRVLARRAVEAAHDALTTMKTKGRLADIADWVGSRSH